MKYGGKIELKDYLFIGFTEPSSEWMNKISECDSQNFKSLINDILRERYVK